MSYVVVYISKRNQEWTPEIQDTMTGRRQTKHTEN